MRKSNSEILNKVKNIVNEKKLKSEAMSPDAGWLE